MNDYTSASGSVDGNPAHQTSGSGYYPPQPPPPVQPPKKSNTGKIILIVVLVVLGLCGIGGVVALMGMGKAADQVSKDIDKSIKEDEATKRAAVQLVAGTCKSTEYDGFEAKVKITNSTKEKESYWVQVDLMAADGKTKLGEAHAITNDLAAGASATVKAMGNVEDGQKFQKGAKCVVGTVN